jgi:hypothetical protein
MVALSLVVVVGGMGAGWLAGTPLLFLTTPVVAAVIAAAAGFASRIPEWKRTALSVLGSLPDGEGRAQLDALLRRLSVAPVSAQAVPLVLAACAAARQLSALELHVAAFEAPPQPPQRDATVERSARWHEALQRCQRGVAMLTQRLEEAGAALGRWQASQGEGTGENLGKLARELNDESRYQQEAAHEVEALLA